MNEIMNEVMKKNKDMVNHPNHYLITTKNGDQIECLDAVRILDLNFNVGNAFKYIWRAGRKDKAKMMEDLKKAIFYLNEEIDYLENEK